MNKKYKGSMIIWVVCLFLVITSVLSLGLKKTFEDNSALTYEINDFKHEQDLYSFMLYFIDDNNEKIRDLMYKNFRSTKFNYIYYFDSLKIEGLEDFRINEAYINEDYAEFAVVNVDTDKKRKIYFCVRPLKDIFYRSNSFIDDNSENKLQNEKNQIINETFANPELYFKNIMKVTLNLDSGNYDFLFEDEFLYVYKDEELLYKFKENDYRKICIVSKEKSIINMRSTKRKYIDNLIIINNGDVKISNLNIRGLIIIKDGDLYADKLSGDGKIFIDGNLISNSTQDGELKNFKSSNKYGLMFDNMLDFKVKLFKR